jgi:DNA-binding NarL/FixJ family response regulator
MSFRILVVDDHEIVRIGIRTVFAQRPDWFICGEAGDGRTAVAEVINSRPDVVILDLLLQGDMSGFDTAVQIRDAAPSCKIVFFSLHDVPATARMAGADAFVSKASGVRELVATIDRLTGENASSNPSAQRQAAAS